MATILIVDDIEENLYLLRYILQKNNFNVMSAVNGSEAYNMAIANPPDLIISDILMPVMDGFTLCRKWQNTPSLKEIPFVIYTATYTEDADRKLALEMGADRFVIKPQEPDVLVDLVIEVLTEFEKGNLYKKEIVDDEVVILKEYNERLIFKIEKKLNELEILNKQLNESKAELSHIFSRISEGFFALDSNWCFSYANEKVGELYACEPQTLIGQNLFDQQAITIDVNLKKAYQQAITEQKYVKIETFDKKIDKWYENHIYPTFDGLSIYFSDITDKKKAAEIIKKSEVFNIAILNALSSQIAVVDAKGFITAVNKRWEKISNEITATEINKGTIGDNYFDIIKKAIKKGNKLANSTFEGINEVLLGFKNSFYLEYPCHSTTEDRWFAMRIIKFENVETMLIFEHQNITERKKTEEILKYNQHILNEAQVLGKISNWEIDFKKGTSFWSDELYAIFGTNKETLASPQNFISFFHPDDQEFVSDKLANAFSALKDDSFSARTIAINGVVKYIYSDYKFEFDEDKNPVRLYGILQDVTNTVLFEKELLEKNTELLKSNRELDRFIYSTSHDLRAPLKSIIGLSDLIVDEMGEDDTEQIVRIDMIKKSVLKLDNFIEDVLINSKNSRTTVEQEAIYFNDLIEEINDSLQFMDEADQVDLILDIEQKEAFLSDKFRIESILNNLISNSVKYHRKSNEQSFVHIVIAADAKHCFITVTDNGIGIQQDKIGHVFDMFYRATVKSTGSGLGLYIVKEMIDKLKGKISVESEVGVGSIFKIEIPINNK